MCLSACGAGYTTRHQIIEISAMVSIGRKSANPVRPAAHRGGKIDEAACPSCKGRVRVFVFSCAKHGRCTVRKTLDLITGCNACGDYSPSV